MLSDYKGYPEDAIPLRGMSASPSTLGPSAKGAAAFELRPKKRKPDYWAWEWLAIMVSFLAIGASSVVLVMFDGKPIPAWSWSSTGISVNAILSLLSTLSRASLLIPIDECMGQLMWLWFAARERRLADVETYNQASRGPVGAAKLLWRQKGIGMGCLGALLMVASMGIGVAQQQLLSYPNRLVLLSNSTSTVTRAERFDTYQNVTTSGAMTPELSFSLLSAIYNAAMSQELSGGPSAVNQPLHTCTSGNCDFPAFSTLAVCSECHSVNDQVKSSCDGNGRCIAEFAGLRATAWQYPNGNNINTILNQTYIDPRYSTSLTSLTGISPFTSLAHLHVPSSDTTATNWPPTYLATECALFWCVKTIHASVKKGIYTEIAITASTTITNNTGTPQITSNGTSYSITQLAYQSFTGSKGITAILTGWARSSLPNLAFSSDIMQGIATNLDIPEVMARVSTALTNRIRDSDSTTVAVSGTTMIKESFIRVRWLWLAFPATVWVVSLGFLITIVVQSREGEVRKGMRVWGANSLALLYYGLDSESRERIQMGEWEQMEELSQRLWVKLETGADGLRLRARKVG